MDNLTHSLTGALAAKVIEVSGATTGDEAGHNRTSFWLLVACANLPDIDVALGFFSDRMVSISHHRGITHSVLFAPVLALLPAALFYLWGKWKNFKALWLLALIGIWLHIFFDIITPFGTQLLAPFSSARYAWDWMFIVDPFFTGVLGLTLMLGKFRKLRRRIFIFGGASFVVLYLGAEILSHHLAHKRLTEALRDEGITATKISVLPQPLSIFRWMGLAQTSTAVVQTYFRLLDNQGPLAFTKYQNADDPFVVKALQTAATKWYLTFARHPWIRSEAQSDRHIVELRDLQFSIDKALLNAVGFPERSTPFVLRHIFPANGGKAEVIFDGKPLPPIDAHSN